MGVVIHLYAPDAPASTPRLLQVDDDRIEVIRDGPARLVAGKGRPRRLVELDIGTRPIRTLRDDGTAHLIYAQRFQSEDLQVLQQRGWCGIDHCGQVVITGPDLAIVVARPRRRPIADHDEPTAATVRGTEAADDTAGVRGAATARLTQLLLETPAQIWRPTDLAEADGLAAVATASRLLAELARLGLVRSIEKGRTHDYRVIQPPLLANWLAERTRPPHPGVTLSCYVRARDVAALIDLLSTRIRNAPYPAVLTGSAAAVIEGVPVTTNLTRALVRVDPTRPLAMVREDLDVDPVSSGANVRLIRDVGQVGTLHHRTVNHVPLAGLVRTWLDLRSEPRGADAADLYWDQVVGPAIGVTS